MSQTDYTMLHDVPAVRAALAEGKPVERLTKGGVWRPVPSSTSKTGIMFLLSVGYQFRIASPSEPQGSQVVSDDEIDAAVDAFDNVYDGVSHNKREAIAAALLARRPCAQGQGEGVGDVRDAHIAWLHSCLHDAGYCIDGGKCHHECLKHEPAGVCGRRTGCVPLTGSRLTDDWKLPAPPATPAGASRHAAQAPVIELPDWPTREGAE